jgi:hypothetical protein
MLLGGERGYTLYGLQSQFIKNTKTVSFFFLFLDLPGQRDKRRAWFELPALPRSRGILFDESAHHASRTLLGEKPVWVVAEEAL